MCQAKDEAKAKMDCLIESMDRLSLALKSATQPITVNIINAPQGTTVTETKDEYGRRIDVMIRDRIASAMSMVKR